MRYLSLLKKKLILMRMVILAFLASLFAISPILVMEKIVDNASSFNLDRLPMILILSFLYLIMQIIGNGLFAYCSYQAKKESREIGADLQLQVYKKLTVVDISEIDKISTIEFANIAVEDSTIIAENYLVPINNLFISIFTFSMALIYMLRINWMLTIILFPLCLLTALVSKKLQSKMEVYVSNKRENSKILFNNFSQIIFGIKSIRSFKKETYFSNVIEDSSNKLKISDIKQAQLESLSEGVLSCLFMITIGLILLVTSIFLIKGMITFGIMVAILMYNNMLVDPLLQLVNIQAQTIKVKESMSRIDALFKMREYKPSCHYEKNINKIVVDDVIFKYPKSDIKMLFNFSVNQKEKILVFGNSGIGKSTLAKILTGFYKPLSGMIHFYNNDIELSHIPYISYLEQDGYLFNLPIKDNILFGDEYVNEKYTKILKICCLEELITEYGDKKIGVNGNKLSGGQCKRILLARTLYKDAPIYVFDEITSSLDENLIDTILDNLYTYLSEKIVIFIDHNNKLKMYVDKIIKVSSTNGVVIGEKKE